jgi:hypothetical protein
LKPLRIQRSVWALDFDAAKSVADRAAEALANESVLHDKERDLRPHLATANVSAHLITPG